MCGARWVFVCTLETERERDSESVSSLCRDSAKQVFCGSVMSFWYIWLNAVTAPRGKTRFVPASYINSPVSYTVSQVTLSFLLCSDIIILSACFTFLLKLCKHLFSGWGWGFSVHIDLIDTDMIRGATGWMSVPRCHGKGQITVLTVSKVSCHCQCFYSGKQDLSGCRLMNRLLCQSLSINTKIGWYKFFILTLFVSV